MNTEKDASKYGQKWKKKKKEENDRKLNGEMLLPLPVALVECATKSAQQAEKDAKKCILPFQPKSIQTAEQENPTK